MDNPLMSVILPVYNAGSYLRMAVLSIVNQTFVDWELLIIDDASTDGALQSIADITDARIRILRNQHNLGLAATLNVGIDQARGEFIARMDQDDISFPKRLEQQLTMLQQHPDLHLVGVRCLAIDEENNPVGLLPFSLSHEDICAKPWRGFYLAHPSWMGRTSWFRKHRYASPAPYLCEDQELLLRSHEESRFATVDNVLFAYRIRSVLNWNKALRTRTSVLKVQWHYFSDRQQWHFAFLSLATFVIRIGLDAFGLLMQANDSVTYAGYRLLQMEAGVQPDLCEKLQQAMKQHVSNRT
jgi:glycosyltransferase involved in cell wall biosynthesis